MSRTRVAPRALSTRSTSLPLARDRVLKTVAGMYGASSSSAVRSLKILSLLDLQADRRREHGHHAGELAGLLAVHIDQHLLIALAAHRLALQRPGPGELHVRPG